jgi:hypothetical protein
MDGIKHSNQIFLFPCMEQLTDMLSNFSRMQIETNCPHARNGTHTGGGGASAEAGPVVGGGRGGWASCNY